jgi:hypothetical protein
VTANKIASSAVTNAKIADSAVTDAKISGVAITKVTGITISAANLTAGSSALTTGYLYFVYE